MRKLLFLLAVLVIIFVGCSQDDTLYLDGKISKNNQNQVPNPYRVPLTRALSMADEYIRQIDGSPATRTTKKVKQVDYLVSTKTRSHNDAFEDTLLYLINYENEEGFALMAADTRLQPVYAVSSESNFNWEDTVENKLLGAYVRTIQQQGVVNPGDSCVKLPDGWTFPGIGGPTDPGFIPGGEHTYTWYANVSPWLSPYQRRFAQDAPFDYYCTDPYTFSERLVGCVPLACAQIMAFHSWPETYNGRTIHWNDINNWDYKKYPLSCHSDLSWMMWQIGVKFGVDYGPANVPDSATTVSYYKMMSYFADFGYEFIGQEKQFKASDVDSYLNEGPIIVSANIVGNSQYGHTFVIDGVKYYHESWPGVLMEDQTVHMYHCVWGWGGKANGYFSWNDNGSIGGRPVIYDDYDDNTAESAGWFYAMKYWNHFVPKK